MLFRTSLLVFLLSALLTEVPLATQAAVDLVTTAAATTARYQLRVKRTKPARFQIDTRQEAQRRVGRPANQKARRAPVAKLTKTMKVQRRAKREANAAQSAINKILPKLVDPEGMWKLRYYDIAYKLELTIRKRHFNNEVIALLMSRQMKVPEHQIFLVTKGRKPSIRYKLLEELSPELREVMAEVWVKQQLHKSPKKRALFLGNSWKKEATYKRYLGPQTPNIDSLSKNNIMKLPLWTRYRMVETRIGELTKKPPPWVRTQATPKLGKEESWTRTQIAVALGYSQKINAGTRWLTIDLLKRPTEMIKLLKSKTAFESSPPKISFPKTATQTPGRKRVRPPGPTNKKAKRRKGSGLSSSDKRKSQPLTAS